MISIGANRNKKAYGIKHYNLDTEAELSQINVNREVMGTTAFIIETSQRYMLNGSKEWKKINSNNNSGGGSGNDDFVYDGGGVEGDENIYDGGGVGGDSSDTPIPPSDDNIYEGGGV
jgi:hypothetical protein